MFSAIRKRLNLTPSVAIAIVALVFALTGGAYAASRVIITSKSQISKKALKELSKEVAKLVPAGKAGAQGAPGASGAPGAPGAPGAATEGKRGDQGIQGIQGVEGKEGSPWTVNGKLPSKKTETGTWSAVAGPPTATVLENGSIAMSSIGFAIPLANEPQVKVEGISYAGTDAECPSTESELEEGGASAKAAPGWLCIYLNNSSAEQLETIHPLQVGPNGAVLVAVVEESLAGVDAFGWWAVTAE